MSEKGFFGKAFSDMKESAKKQHEVDKAEFNAVKMESKANFEENRGKNTFRKAKEMAKQSWDDAHMNPQMRQDEMNKERQARIKEANNRISDAENRLNELKK